VGAGGNSVSHSELLTSLPTGGSSENIYSHKFSKTLVGIEVLTVT
jgi:hypothetical protein